jgi:hypothetical protein
VTAYAETILAIDPTVNARHVEAHMRAEYSTLDHLPRATFKQEIRLFRACEAYQPGYGEALARSFGL